MANVLIRLSKLRIIYFRKVNEKLISVSFVPITYGKN